MRVTPEQRAAWLKTTAGGPFNQWLNARVRDASGTLSLEQLYAVAREYGLDVRERYTHLNPGQQRMNVGNMLRRVVPPEVYGGEKTAEADLAADAAEAVSEPLETEPAPAVERPEFIREAGVRELLTFHGQIIDELRSRAIIRTSNAPLGDYAELLFANAFAWDLGANSASGHDAVDLTGVRYQIKARRLTRHNASRQLSAIRKLPEMTFDVLAAALFNEDYTVLRAALIPHAVVAETAKRREHTNSWRFILQERVWEMPGVKDVTAQIRRAAEAF